MSGLLATYEEKKPDLKPEEKADRLHIIKLLKESVKHLRHDFDLQTKQFEMGNFQIDTYFRGDKTSGRETWGLNEDNSATMVTDASNIGFSLNNDKVMRNSPSDNILLNNRINSAQPSPISQGGQLSVRQNSFDTNCIEAQKKLEALEKQHLLIEGNYDEAVQWRLGENMMHSYFLDTATHIRSTVKCGTDILMIILIICFVMGGLFALREKKFIGNYH